MEKEKADMRVEKKTCSRRDGEGEGSRNIRIFEIKLLKQHLFFF